MEDYNHLAPKGALDHPSVINETYRKAFYECQEKGVPKCTPYNLNGIILDAVN